MHLLLCAMLAAAGPRPTIAILPPVPQGSAAPWVGMALADNVYTRLLFHSRFDPKTVTRVYPLNAFGWRQTLAAARGEGIDVNHRLKPREVKRLRAQLGSNTIWTGFYSFDGQTVTLTWRLLGSPSTKPRTRAIPLAALAPNTDSLAGDLLVALGQTTEGLSGHAMRDIPPAAMEAYARALEILSLQSLDPRAHLVLPKDKIKKARALLTQATDAHPEFVRAWVMRGIASAMLNDLAAAEAALVSAMASAGEFEPTTSLGLYYLYDRSGEPKKGIEVLEEATKTHLGFLHGLGYLGQAYMRASENHEALRVFSTYQARVPKNPWARVKRTAALAHVGKFDLAIAELETLREELPRSVMVLTALASRQIDARKLEDAQRTIDEGLRLHPDHPALLTRASYVQLELNQPAKALELAQKAVAKLGDGRGETLAGYAHLNLAHALALLHRTPEALTALAEAKRLGVDAEEILVLRRDPRVRDFMNDPRNPFRLPVEQPAP